jgi:uncharacterized protein
MTRTRTIRKVSGLPLFKSFKPYGGQCLLADLQPVVMLLDEYEALRLCDYMRLNHQQASAEMQVSRPTFTRVYASALNKIATAFVEGRELLVDGGKVCFDSDWYRCSMCSSVFTHPEKQEPLLECALCGSEDVHCCSDNFENEINNQ